ncbi:MAG TPA: hypothetical protein VI729_09325 [Anaerolineales bacterium]|nr:hypothetical protein [Anaerolineales bacterium]
MSPTARSLARLREAGYIACVVEKFNSFSKTRVDAFGFGDILAIHPVWKGAVLVQATTGDNAAKRRQKILALPDALAWLKAGNWILVHGWAKRGGRGERKVWTVKSEQITADMFGGKP